MECTAKLHNKDIQKRIFDRHLGHNNYAKNAAKIVVSPGIFECEGADNNARRALKTCRRRLAWSGFLSALGSSPTRGRAHLGLWVTVQALQGSISSLF